MKNSGRGKFNRLLAATFLGVFLTLTPHPALAQEAQAAQATPTYTEKVVSWWSGLKNKVSAQVEALRQSMNQQAPATPAPAVTETQPAKTTPTDATTKQSVTSGQPAAVPVPAGPDLTNVKPFVTSKPKTTVVPAPGQKLKPGEKPAPLIVLTYPKAATLPAFKNPVPPKLKLRETPKVEPRIPPVVTYAKTRPLPAPPAFSAEEQKVLATTVSPARHQQKYPLPPEVTGPLKLPKTAAKRELTLKLIPEFTPLAISNISVDQIKLVRALLEWLHRRTDNALAQLNALTGSTTEALLKEKTLAFSGWIFQAEGYPALASVALSEALEHAGAKPEPTEVKVRPIDYDSAISETLSAMSKETALAKTLMSQPALDRLTGKAQGAKPDTHPAATPQATAQQATTSQAPAASTAPSAEPQVKIELTKEASGFLMLLQAERAFDRSSFATARKWALGVSAGSSWKDHARYLAATSSLGEILSKPEALPATAKGTSAKGPALDKDRGALETAGRELTDLFRTVEDPGLFDVTAASLGHVHFMLGNYKAAHQYLSQVSRETNLFIESAVDNAWALLRTGDRNTAVGNMFTLHTPYFEGAYMPDSYFIQALGYQEICQFGDAISAVKQYKTRYNDSLRKTVEFNNGGKTKDAAYYEDLTTYLSKKETKLPHLVLRELGRQPYFLRRQKALNQIAREERNAVAGLKASGAPFVKRSEPAFNRTRAVYKEEIAKFLKHRALAIEEELKFLTANMALLEYEIYAGAGANLAMQGAKNFAVEDKEGQAKRKQQIQEGKEYWPYEDEIWEDELNNFRSKMVDACAKANRS